MASPRTLGLYDAQYYDRTDHWSRQPKYREELETLFSRLELNGRSVILDLGCNTGNVLSYIRRRYGCTVIGLDYPEAWMNKCRVPGVVRSDGRSLPFSDGVFDAVLLLHVIGHVEDPRKVIQEAHRVLKTGGTLGMITPNARFVHMMRMLDFLTMRKYPSDQTVLRYFQAARLRSLVMGAPWRGAELATFGELPHFLRLFPRLGFELRDYRERICCVVRK
jgi:SAM-dependent methyltransferase